LISEAHNRDCMAAMAEMEDNAFDLAIVDVPYGIGENGSTNHTRGKLAVAQDYKAFAGADRDPPPNYYFRELCRVSRDQIIWGANHFISRIDDARDANSPCWIVWDKDNGANDFADCELAWSSFPTAVRRFKYTWNGMLQQDMANKERRIHPTQKPVALYKWLLTNYAKEGDKILDTHLGSGSSRIAAYDLGFDFTGYELDKDYFNAQEQRFANHIAQPKLFEAPKPVQATFEMTA
jgi:site-specific DNA-methyltransferase (adenine-specific)